MASRAVSSSKIVQSVTMTKPSTRAAATNADAQRAPTQGPMPFCRNLDQQKHPCGKQTWSTCGTTQQCTCTNTKRLSNRNMPETPLRRSGGAQPFGRRRKNWQCGVLSFCLELHARHETSQSGHICGAVAFTSLLPAEQSRWRHKPCVTTSLLACRRMSFHMFPHVVVPYGIGTCC